jgi:hypothetical protein
MKEGIGSCFTFKGEVVKSPGDKQPVILKINLSYYLSFFLIRIY